ncbi:MAG: hypothetical protein ACTSYI_09550, partial [Promethearchaeota archaeon]
MDKILIKNRTKQLIGIIFVAVFFIQLGGISSTGNFRTNYLEKNISSQVLSSGATESITSWWDFENNYEDEFTVNTLNTGGSGNLFVEGIGDGVGINFDGNGWADRSYDFDNGYINRSFTFWTKIPVNGGGRIFTAGKNTAGGYGGSMSFGISTETVYYGGYFNDFNYATTISSDEWHFICVIYNQNNKQISVWIDSELIITNTMTYDAKVGYDEITIGSYAGYYGERTDNYNGTIDEFKYYNNYALSSSEIETEFNSESSEDITRFPVSFHDEINNYIYGTYSEKFGTVLLYQNSTDNRIYVTNSTDMKTWHNSRSISGSYSNLAQGSVLALSNGTLFVLFESGSWPQVNCYYLQTDDLINWSPIRQATNDNYYEGNPKLFELSGNRMGLTYYNGPYSTEDGVCRVYENGAWSAPRMVYNAFQSPNVGAPTVFVNSTGDWTMLFAKGDPSQLYITFSQNEGLSWTTPEVFRSNIHANSYALFYENNTYHLFYGNNGVDDSIFYEYSADFTSWSTPDPILTVGDWGLWSYTQESANKVLIFHDNSTDSNIFEITLHDTSEDDIIIIEDDFNDGNYDGWDVIDGTWESSSNYLRSKGWAQFENYPNTADYPAEIKHDFGMNVSSDNLHLNFDFRYESPFTSGIRGQNIQIKLMINQSSYLSFLIRQEGSGDDKFIFDKCINDVVTNLGERIYSPDTQWHNIKWTIMENTMTLYYDENVFISGINDVNLDSLEFDSMHIHFGGWDDTVSNSYRNIDNVILIDNISDMPVIPMLQVNQFTIDDDSSDSSDGNGDGIVQAGETIELLVTLENTGMVAVTGVTATLSVSDNLISISDDSEDYPDITAGGTAQCVFDYDFTVDPAHAGGTVTFTLSITCNEGSFTDTFTIAITAAANDDNYEENDDLASAYDLSSYEGVWLSSINGYGIQAD